MSNNSEKSCRKILPKILAKNLAEKRCIIQFFSTAFDKFRQKLPGDAKNAVEFCRKLVLFFSEKNCCQNLSKNAVIYSVFRQISTKNLKNFVECRSILAKNVVAFCRKILAKKAVA